MYPASAITLLGKNEQGIILSSHQSDESYYIKSIVVNNSRDALGGSTAEIILIPRITSLSDEIPPLPDVSKWRGGNYPYLDSFDEIRVYGGYLDSPSKICPHHLDIIPFEFGDTPRDYIPPLKPVFTGFIQSITAFADATKGFAIRLQLFDRSYHLRATRITALNTKPPNLEKWGKWRDVVLFEGGKIEIGDFRISDYIEVGISLALLISRLGIAPPKLDGLPRIFFRRPVLPGDKPFFRKGDRPALTTRTELLLALANQASQGDIVHEHSCWREVEPGLIYEKYGSEDELTEVPDALQWMNIATYYPSTANEVKLHTWTTRPRTKQGISGFNKAPIDMIGYLLNSEETPIEFFSSPINGDYIYGPVILDTSGFSDVQRCNRSYFYRSVPKGMGKPNPRQLIKSIRHSSSSVAMFNKFQVVDSATNSDVNEVLESLSESLSYLPWSLRGRTPCPPERLMLLPIDMLDYYKDARGGAQVIAGTAARALAKDTNVIQIEVLGDASLQPGEAIAVWGVPGLHSIIDKPSQEAAYREFGVVSEAPKANASEEFRKAMDYGKAYGSEFGIYRISSVRHTLESNRGFVSQITASADY